MKLKNGKISMLINQDKTTLEDGYNKKEENEISDEQKGNATITNIIINPGTGSVLEASEENAIENIKCFISDNGVEDIVYKRIPNSDYGDGRYAFCLKKDGICHEIQMPGLTIEKVRYLGNEDQNIWNYPRLYVDGSSWVWKYALGLSFEEEIEKT